MNQVSIIVPVYGDWSSLKECVRSLIQHIGDTKHEVLFINDCGPDVDEIETRLLAAIKGQKNFSYYRNKKNIGFLKTCNRAVTEIDTTNNDILLLNSDTKVTDGFIDGLQSVFLSDETIGAVSPRTNNATIATIPISQMKNKELSQEVSHNFYKQFATKLPSYTIAPVAHGFCILIRRELIKKYGLFDEVFGAGYGEETDFCLRIASKGYKSAICNRAYVFHLEARSFTLDRKKKLLETSAKIIDKRYPSYMRKVRKYTLDMIKLEDDIMLPFFKRFPRQVYRKLRSVLGNLKRRLL